MLWATNWIHLYFYICHYRKVRKFRGIIITNATFLTQWTNSATMFLLSGRI